MAFQKDLNRDLPRGVAGDFASTNPRASMLAGEGALVAGEDIIVGRFAFADTSTGKVYKAFATGYRTGFVHRNNNAIVALGQAASMVIPAGREIALFPTGDFYTIFAEDVEAGDKVYCSATDGTPTIDDTNEPTNYICAETGVAGQLVKITVLG